MLVSDNNFGEVPFNKTLSLVTQDVLFLFHSANPQGVTYGGLPRFATQLDIVDIVVPRVLWTTGSVPPSLHCPIASTQSQ